MINNGGATQCDEHCTSNVKTLLYLIFITTLYDALFITHI